jgi:hypothetical protein
MATPHIAGVAALLRQAHPEWTPDQVKSMIVSGAHSLGLDPSVQGSGMVDVLASLQLGGIPSPVARIGGTPLRDFDVPTTRYGAFSSALTVTNETLGSLTFTGSFTGDAGLTATLTPATFTLDPGATASVTVARQIDHDIVASGVDAQGTITFASAQGSAEVGVEVGVRPRLSAAPASADLAVDLASQGTWTGQTTLVLTNVRTDEAQTYAASIQCCSSASQAGGGSIVATLDQSSLPVAAGGTVSLGATVTATNGALANGRYSGSISLTSSLGSLTVPVTFFKGYGLQVRTTSTPQSLAVSSDQGGASVLSTVDPSTTFYSTTPGPFYVEAVWPYQATHQHVLATVDSDVPLPSVTLDPAQAIYTYTLQPRDQNDAALSGGMLLQYRFTHASTGGGVVAGASLAPVDAFPIYVSAIPVGIDFTASVLGVAGDPIGYLYELSGPAASNQLFTNAPADLVTRQVRVFRPGVGGDAPYFLPEVCLPWLPWGPPGPGGAIGGVRAVCESNLGVALPTGVGTMRFYNSANRDLLAAPYPDAPSISYQILDGGPSGQVLFNGPQLYVSATHPLSWSLIAPWAGTVLANQAYAASRCDDAPGGVLAVAPGPLVDQWSWWNHQVDHSTAQSRRGQFENPFAWGGCVQDEDYLGTPVSYSLSRDGVLLQSATVSLNSPIEPTLTDGPYSFQMTRSPTIGGVATQVQTVTTFTVSSVSSIDENPPALRALHLLGRSLWQDVLDPAVVGQLRFNVDPVAGFASPNPPASTPPLFAPLADSLTAVRVQQSLDGSTWKDVPATALGGGDYQTDPLDVDPTATLTWFRISATDQAGNTLAYTFQVPRGTSDAPAGSDTSPPTASITQPAGGTTLSGVATVTAVAIDDVGVAEVDLLVDGTKVAASAAAPYTFSFDTSSAAPGSHALVARAQDAAGNVGYSAAVSVTTETSDTTPPVVSMTSPASGAIVAGTVTVSATATDDKSVARVEFRDGATLLGAATAAPYSVSWGTSSAAAGAHTLSATAYDPAGNSATATVSVTVDDVPPTVSVTAPANGAAVAGTVTLSATATDNTAVARVVFYDGATLIATATGAPYSTTWNAAAAGLGPHTLKARAYDVAGNFADSEISVTVSSDLTPPTVTFVSPVEGGYMGRYNNVLFNVTDNVGVVGGDLYDGATLIRSFANMLPPFGDGYDTSNVADGPHTLTAHAWDAAGNIGVARVDVTIDKVAPTVAITAPANSVSVSDVVTIQGTATDNNALGTVSLVVDSTTLWTGTTSPPAVTWSTLAWADGWHTVALNAYDQAQNYGTTYINVNVQNSVAPTVTSPAAGALVGAAVPLTATTTNNAAVANLTFYDGTTALGTATAPPFAITWNPATSGAHSLTVKATDLQGRVTTSPAVSVTADVTPPSVALKAPASGATVSGAAVTVSATASDNVGVAGVAFYCDGNVLLGSDATSPYSIAWDTTTTTAGSHALTAVSTDRAGNATTSASRSITVKDVTAPAVTISSPANHGQVTAGSTTSITAAATDLTGVSKVQFLVNGASTCTVTAAPYVCSWKVPSGTGKTYSLVAKAFDAANNAGTSPTVSVTSK